MRRFTVIIAVVLVLAGLLALAVRASVALADEPATLVYDPHGARDPFLPLVTSAGTIITYDTNLAVTEMTLEGIVEGGGARVAIINADLVEVGQMIGLYRVDQIEADGVVLLKDGQTSVLQLKREE